jgi:hypothetical protein
MTIVCAAYLFVATVKNGGLFLDSYWGTMVGVVVGLASMGFFIFRTRKFRV